MFNKIIGDSHLELKDFDVPLKMERVKQWCIDINIIRKEKVCDFVFSDEDKFKKEKILSFKELCDIFINYK